MVAGILLTASTFGCLHGPEYSWAWQYVVAVSLAGVVFGVPARENEFDDPVHDYARRLQCGFRDRDDRSEIRKIEMTTTFSIEKNVPSKQRYRDDRMDA